MFLNTPRYAKVQNQQHPFFMNHDSWSPEMKQKPNSFITHRIALKSQMFHSVPCGNSTFITGITITIQNEICSYRYALGCSVVSMPSLWISHWKENSCVFPVCKIAFIWNIVHWAETLHCDLLYFISGFYSYNLMVIEAELSTCTKALVIFSPVFWGKAYYNLFTSYIWNL